jgi:two-component system, chemotaxis family, sensor kinase CheA
LDPQHSPELIALFRQELEERSAALVEAARRLLVDNLDAEALETATRDAHTIKGSARLMGNEPVASAAAALEQAWRALGEQRVERSTELAAGLIELAERLGRSAEGEDPVDLAKSVSRVDRAFGLGSRDTARRLPAERGVLGGLLSSVTTSLLDGVTRVDTGELYRLVNRLVEVALDAAALSDLSLVSLEGGDPRRILTAWRSHMERLTDSMSEIQDQAVSLANIPFREAAETFPQFIRYLGRKLSKDVRFELTGDDVELDRQIVEQLREPLRHLLVNAVDHGLEPPDVRLSKGKSATGLVSLHAQRRDDRVQISVSDDGAGIDWKAVEARAAELGLELGDDSTPLLLRPDFSTRAAPDDFSGTGEGLSVVADVVERIHGGLQIESVPDEGTTVVLTLPISLVLQNMVVVAVGDQFWGLPEASVVGVMTIADPRTQMADEGRVLRFEGHRVPVVSLAAALGIGSVEPDREVVVMSGRAGLVAVTVPEILDRRRVAVKDLGPILEGAAHITAAAFLGGGEVLVVVDPHFLAEFARAAHPEGQRRPVVLVVDDSAGVRQLISASLTGSGFDVVAAPDAREAVQRLSESAMDALVVDYSMPRSSGVDLVRERCARPTSTSPSSWCRGWRRQPSSRRPGRRGSTSTWTSSTCARASSPRRFGASWPSTGCRCDMAGTLGSRMMGSSSA